MKNKILFKHFFKNKEQLSTDERINNFSEGGVMAIIISVSLIILSTLLILNAADIIDVGRTISEKEASNILAITTFTYIICYGLIVFIWIMLFMNLSDKDTFKNELNDKISALVESNKKQKKSNRIGTAGFVIALIVLFVYIFCSTFYLFYPTFLGSIIWLLGLIFSIVGVFKSPKGLSIAGLIISLCYILYRYFFYFYYTLFY
tara:strand:- start:394 stop:1005 length:612 start_codon:yes stop_codon:yes gene_type:complete